MKIQNLNRYFGEREYYEGEDLDECLWLMAKDVFMFPDDDYTNDNDPQLREGTDFKIIDE